MEEAGTSPVAVGFCEEDKKVFVAVGESSAHLTYEQAVDLWESLQNLDWSEVKKHEHYIKPERQNEVRVRGKRTKKVRPDRATLDA